MILNFEKYFVFEYLDFTVSFCEGHVVGSDVV